MAVRVKVRKPKPPPAPVLKAADWAYPSDVKERSSALMAGIGLPFALLALLGWPSATRNAALVWLVWVVAAAAFHAWLRPSSERRALRRFEAKEAADVAFARMLQGLLGRIGAVHALPRGVRVTVITKGVAPMTLGRAIVVPVAMRKDLTEREATAMLAREAGHIAAGHVALMNLLRSTHLAAKPLAAVGLPLYVLTTLLRHWAYYAEITADRFAALMLGEGKSVAQAIIRISLSGEPEKEEGQISAEEIARHLAASEGLKADQEQITTHFRLGEYLKDHPDLYARLREISNWVGSTAYKSANAKLRPPQAAAPPSDKTG